MTEIKKDKPLSFTDDDRERIKSAINKFSKRGKKSNGNKYKIKSIKRDKCK